MTAWLKWIGAGMGIARVLMVTLTVIFGDIKVSPAAEETFKDCPECPEMAVIPAGVYMMGSPPNEEGRDDNEEPVHEILVSRSFAFGKYEVTRSEFAAFVQATGYRVDDGCYYWTGGGLEMSSAKNWRDPGFRQTDRDPVVCLSWNDAKAYVEWLGRKTGKHYRLPSEAEWEYAARARTTTARYWGESADNICRFANGADLTARKAYFGWTVSDCHDGYVHTAPVGSFQANPFGLYDILGNVWEWIEDCWHAGYGGAPQEGSAWITEEDCRMRVLRGGSWNYAPRGLRAANRSGDHSANRYSSTGLRVVRDLSWPSSVPGTQL